MGKRVWASVAGLSLIGLQGGCATYYEPHQLMTNQQVVAASCEQLAEERAKLQSNVAASDEGSMFGMVGTALLAVGEGYAGTDGSSTAAMAQSVGTSEDLGTNWQARLDLVSRVSARKGCS